MTALANEHREEVFLLWADDYSVEDAIERFDFSEFDDELKTRVVELLYAEFDSSATRDDE